MVYNNSTHFYQLAQPALQYSNLKNEQFDKLTFNQHPNDSYFLIETGKRIYLRSKIHSAKFV